ncbi:MAG: ABC transporter permease [Clostridiales bacterium]|jgi:ABC-2 type transport system permease protein|nr:ABC transporter permease [Clostridiales bacterium]
MKAIGAIFSKQLVDLPKNMSVTIMFIMFPILSFIMTGIMGGDDPLQAAMMNVQFAMMFVGMTPLVTVANTIAEDNEYKSLRFMVTAGVRPGQYLTGIMGFTMLVCIVPLALFALIGGFGGQELLIFLAFGFVGIVASCILGAVVGIFSKNVQQCAAIYSPLMMLLAFAPFLSMFNETIAVITSPLFTTRIFESLSDMTLPEYFTVYQAGEYVTTAREAISTVSLPISLAIIAANALTFAILFAVAYRKKGLRG